MKRFFVACGALLGLAVVACSSGARAVPTPTTSSTSGDGKLVRAGLWAADNAASVGFSLRVKPGEDPDHDTWYFFVDGSEHVECTPSSTAADWLFEDCDKTGTAFSQFGAVIPKKPNPDIEITYAYGSAARSTKMHYIPELDEDPVLAVERVWFHEWNEDCENHTGIWAEAGLVFAPCREGFVEILDGASGKRMGLASQDAARGRNRSAVLEVTARDGRLYAATTGRGVVIWDVRDPAAPKLIGQFFEDKGSGSPQNAFNIHTLTLSPKGNLLFAVNQSHPRSDVRIIDVSDPTKPHEVGRYLPNNSGSLSGGAHDLALEEREGRLIAYLNQLKGGFRILDVTNPANILELGVASWDNVFSHSVWPFQSGGKRYVLHGDEGYNQGLAIFDVTELTRPKVVSRFQTRAISTHNFRVKDGFAYVSYYLDGLRVFDIRDPARPKEVAHYDTVEAESEERLFSGAWGVHLDNGLVYVSDTLSGIYAFRVRLPD
jgi:hypothetical protein